MHDCSGFQPVIHKNPQKLICSIWYNKGISQERKSLLAATKL